MKKTYIKFDGLWEFDKYLNEHRPTANYEKDYLQYSRKEYTINNCWAGTKTWPEAVALFNNGDAKIAKEIKGGVIETLKNNKRFVSRIETCVVGAAPHVPNFIAGRPNAMIRLQPQPKKMSVVTCIYNISVNAGITPELMRQAAIKMLSAVKMLEDSGTRVNLYLADISVRGEEEIGWAMRIKTASQHLDILKTAYPLCNPAMLRRHSFRFTEVTPQNFGAGEYGRASEDTTELCKQCGIRDAISIGFSAVGRKTAKELAEHIIKQAAQHRK